MKKTTFYERGIFNPAVENTNSVNSAGLVSVTRTKTWQLFMGFVLFFLSFTTYAQINYTQNFDTTTHAWTGGSQTTSQPCAVGSYRFNVWSFAPTANLVSPLVGTSNAGVVTLNFDYKIVNYDSANPTVATPNTFGTVNIQYATSASGPWTTVGTIGTEHVPANTCAVKSVTFSPIPGDTYLRIQVLLGTGDYFFYIDNLSATQGAAPACVQPSSAAATNVAATTATINWTAPASAPANGYEYEVRTSGAAGSGATGLVASGTETGLFVGVTGLAPQTVHNAYVRSVCGASEFSSWTMVSSFTTACVPLTTLPWTESFEGLTAGTNVFPLCWAYANTASTWFIEASNAHTGTNSLRRSWSTDGWAFTPMITLTAGTSYDFVYWMRTADTTVGYEVVTAVGNSQTSAAMTTTLGTTGAGQTYQNPAYTKYTFSFVPATTGDYSFGVKAAGPNPPNGINFDDFTVELSPACPAPQSLSASLITSETATVSWISAGTLFDIEYGTAGFTATGTPTIAGVTNNFEIESLTPNTSYDYYVRRDCAVDGTSVWAGPFTFKTECSSFTDLNENFDALTSNFSTTMPDCWKRAATTGTCYVTTGSVAPMSPSNKLYMFSNGTAPATVAYATLPVVSNLGANTHRLRFKAYSSSAAGRKLQVGYLATAGDQSSFTLIQEVTLPGTAATTATEFFVVPGTLPLAEGSLCFKNAHTVTAESNSVYIDDVKWEAIPSCPEPTALTASGMTFTSATVSWTSASSLFDIEYGIQGFTPTGTPTIAGITNNFEIESLTAETTYCYYVRTDCGVDGTSVWAGPYCFYTGYCVPAPTSVDAQGITNVTMGTINNTTVAEAGNYGNYSAMSTDVQQTATVPVNITFTTLTYGYGVKIWVDWNQDLQFDDATERVYWQDTADGQTSPWVKNASFVVPATQALGSYRLRIGALDTAGTNGVNVTPCYAASYGTYEDYTINVIAAPSCQTPTDLVVSNITAVSADVAWTAPASAPSDGYHYYVSTTNTAPDGTTTPTGSTAAGVLTVNLTSLASNTMHYVWVRSNCGTTNGNSEWSIVASFKTACSALTTLPWTEGFEGIAAGTNIFPDCWGYVNTSSTWFIAASNAHSGANSLRRSWGTDGWAFTPMVTLTAGTSYDFSYWMRTADTTVGYEIVAGVGTEKSIAGMTTTLGTTGAGQTYQNPTYTKYTYSFVPTTTGDYTFGVRAAGPFAPNGINFDDFKIEVTPTCMEPMNVTGVATSFTAATINWTASASTPADGYEYYYSTSNTAPDGTTTPSGSVAAGVTTANLSPLTAESNYYVWVRANCGSGSMSSWSAMGTFYTGYCKPAPTSVDAQGITNVTMGTINNTTVAEAGNYGNYSAMIADVEQGATVPVNITFNTDDYEYGVKIWVDWNNDLVFDDATEKVFYGPELTTVTDPWVMNATFTVPAAQALGNYRLRIGALDVPGTDGASITPCYAGSYGTYEDYTINVVVPIPAPSNDHCVSAAPIPNGGVFDDEDIDGTTVGADTSATAPTCNATAGTDVYYSVTIPTSGNLTIETKGEAGGLTNTDIVVYSGVCGTLTEIACDDNSSDDGEHAKVVLTGQTAGTVLIVRVFSHDGTSEGEFKIAAYDVSLGTNNFDVSNFKAYPNPVSDVLNLTYTYEISEVKVFNMLGQEVLVAKPNTMTAQIGMNQLNAGTYLVEVTANGATKTMKVVKK